MKKFQKAAAVTLSMAMLGATLVACGGSASSSTAASATGEASTAGSKTYTMFMRSTYADWIKELKWYDEAEARTGVTVEYVSGPEEFADCYSEVDQRIISNTLPDAVMTKLSQTNVYGPQGAFMDLAPLIKEYAPNIQKYIDENPDYKALMENDKGQIFSLIKATPIFADLIGYRADQLEKAGIDAASIQTVDDFTEALRTLKATYGADNKNYYPLSGRDSALRFAAWFGCPSSISSTESNGVYISGHYKDGSFDIMSPNAYTMMETMKTWYDEGLINPEWVAGTFGEADWEAGQLNGNSTIFYDYYNRAEWFMENGGPEADPDYQMAVLDFLKDDDGNVMKVTTSTKYNDETTTAINANCSEETAKTIIQFIDYFYSEEGMVLANYGVEGESFEVAADGEKEFIVDYTTEEAKPAGEKKWSFLSDRLTVCKPVDDEAFFKWNTPLIAEAAGRCFQEDNMMTSYTLSFGEDASKELSNLVSTVYDAEVAGMTSFINGTRELNETEWTAFQQEMVDQGLSRIEEIQLEAYNQIYG